MAHGSGCVGGQTQIYGVPSIGMEFFVSAKSIFPSSPLRFPEWQREYESALLETDQKALFRCVEAAEAAVLTRRDALLTDDDEERRAIQDALSNLGVLKREQLQFRSDPMVAVPRFKED
jgi:hypothetical protein